MTPYGKTTASLRPTEANLISGLGRATLDRKREQAKASRKTFYQSLGRNVPSAWVFYRGLFTLGPRLHLISHP